MIEGLESALTTVRLRTPLVELRLGTERELRDLGELFRHGTYPEEAIPFSNTWLDHVKEPAWVDTLVSHHRAWLQESTQHEWRFNLLAFAAGQVIGSQGLSSRDELAVSTNSLIARRYQRHGYGTQMRAAVLHLAFVVLGARHAFSDAWVGNEASIAVSRKLGYEDAGIEVHHPRGVPVPHQVLRLDATAFSPIVPVIATGTEPLAQWLAPWRARTSH